MVAHSPLDYETDMLDIVQIPVLQDNYIYVAHEPKSGETAVIDPAVADPVLDLVKNRGWRIDYIFNTHHHPDHVGGNMMIQDATGCQIIGNQDDAKRLPGLTSPVLEGDVVSLGEVNFRVIDVPGHTIGHIAYYAESVGVLFCGDTLFSMGCGRLFEGTPDQMWESLQKFKALPAETMVYCAHEYTAANAQFALSVDPDNLDLQTRAQDVRDLRAKGTPTVPMPLGVEFLTNPFLRADDPQLAALIGKTPGVEAFAEIRHRKDIF